MPSFGPRCLPSPNRSYAPRLAPVNSNHGRPDSGARAAASSRRLPLDGGDATNSAARSLSTSVADASEFEVASRRTGRLEPRLRQLCTRGLATTATRTTTSDRAGGGGLLPRLAGHSSTCRCGRQVDGTAAPAGTGAAAAACGAPAQARFACSTSDRWTVRCVIEATVSRKVRRRCFRSQPAIRIRSAGRLLRSQTDSDLRPVTGTARACFRTIRAAPHLRAARPLLV
jgi:hypothetical protein